MKTLRSYFGQRLILLIRQECMRVIIIINHFLYAIFFIEVVISTGGSGAVD